MYKVSIIIVYNDAVKFEKARQYISAQTMADSIELIALDNRSKRFSSAAQALNYGASASQASVLIFMHQDIYLFDEEAISKYYTFLTEHPKVIAGVAGVSKSDLKIYGDILEGEHQIQRLTPTNGDAVEAISVDECFFGMHRSLWEEIKFDEITCDDWHYYGVDICYENMLRGNKNVIYSLRILHDSLGRANPNSFMVCTKKMVKKYRGKVDRLEGTCIHIKCGYLPFYLLVIRKKLVRIKNKLLSTT